MKRFAQTAFVIAVLVGAMAATPAVLAEGTGAPEVAAVSAEMDSGATPSAAGPAMVKRVEYALPYPGMLPDHPLYNLKRLRDAILERVIAEPVKKAEFFVLQADKRLAMGMTLMEQQGKATLAESTISKGGKYMERAVSVLKTYKAGGNYVPPGVNERLAKSIAKHKEVIIDLKNRAADAQKAGMDATLALLSALEADLTKLQ